MQQPKAIPGWAYKNQAVLALMLLQLILCWHDACAHELCYYGGYGGSEDAQDACEDMIMS
jgi:hypothetical protein